MSLPWLVALLGCVAGPPVAPRRAPDVLLVTLDTTRADRVGAYGYDGARTPHLDALAARGRRYAHASTTVPLTIPAHASILTGRHAADLGIRANGDAWLEPEVTTLAEVFRGAGYATAASVAAFVTTREWGFDQGFDAYFDDVPRGADFWHAERRGADVVDDLLTWTTTRTDDRPVFAWVHLYDPHQPFTTGEPWLSACGGRPYDAELAYVDEQVGRLVAAFGPDALIVVVGDHGEGLGDHGELSHGLFVYDATTRVPWIVAGPGVAPAVVEAPVSVVDVAPVVASLAGVPALSEASGRAEPGGPVVVESWQLAQRFGLAPHRAVVVDGWKLVDLPRPELYDLRADPGETRDLAAADPDRVVRLRAALAAVGHEPPAADAAHPASPAAMRQLEALGYVEGGFLGDPDAPPRDPKDAIPLLAGIQELEALTSSGRSAEAASRVLTLASDHPDVVELQLKRARVLAERGEADRAIEEVRRLLDRDPDNVVATHQLGGLLALAGRFDEASQAFRAAADRMPYAPRLRVMAVATLLRTDGGAGPALDLARGWLDEHPDDLALAGLLGVELVRRGDLELGYRLLQRAAQAPVPEPDVAWLLAAAATGRGEVAGALTLLELELRNHPDHAPAMLAWARLVGRGGDWQAQLDHLQAWLGGPGRVHFALDHQPPAAPGVDRAALPHAERTAEPLADLVHLEAQALFNLGRYGEAREALDRGLAIDPDRAALLLLDANLLWHEGHPDEARARFALAERAREAEVGAADPWMGLGPAPR